MKNWLVCAAVIMMVGLVAVGCGATGGGKTETATTTTETIKAPWAGFPEGAFVHYKEMDPKTGMTIEYRETLAKVQGNTGVVVKAVLMAGKWEKVGMTPVSFQPFSKPKSDKEFPTQTFTIGDKKVTAKVVTMTRQMGEKSTTGNQVMSDEVPGGLVRMEMAGKCVWEAVEFGMKSEIPSLEEVVQMKSPWAGFPEGAWRQYKMLNPKDGIAVECKDTIVKVTKETATVENATLENGNWKKSEKTAEVSLAPMARPPMNTPRTVDVVKVGDKELKCFEVEMVNRMGDIMTVERVWMCDDVPGGICRKSMAGQVVWELVGFGTK
ncbi:MAG: hypothetical protein HY762_09550 [Planctomycetes bacterium]|nr:hypothetical protein [Planctomycetota bacterium]